MSVSNILAEKKVKSIDIKEKYSLLKKYKPIGLIKISDEQVARKLVEGLKMIPWCFLVTHESFWDELITKNIALISKIDENLLIWFDFVVADENIGSFWTFSSQGIAPIMMKNNHLGTILQEFNPLKNEWNSFLYDEMNAWSIFYAIVRYLENYKFPFDNKNLVKNILSI